MRLLNFMSRNSGPRVSIVILNWNGRDVIGKTLVSVHNQEYPLWEVVVVDNGSTDGSPAVISRDFPHVTVILNEMNVGFAAGINVGIRHALKRGADSVLLLNSDARLAPTATGSMVSAMLADPQRGVIVPKIYVQSEDFPRRIWAAGAEWRRCPPRVTMRGYNELERGQYNRGETVAFATGCALLVRRDTFKTAGLMDESYFMYQEDYAFCDQVRRNGRVLWYEPEAVVRHLVSHSAGEGSARKWRHWARGIVLFYVQHYRARWRAAMALLAFIPWVVLRETVKAKQGWFIPFCQGLAQGWDDLRQMGA